MNLRRLYVAANSSDHLQPAFLFLSFPASSAVVDLAESSNTIGRNVSINSNQKRGIRIGNGEWAFILERQSQSTLSILFPPHSTAFLHPTLHISRTARGRDFCHRQKA